MAMIFPVISVDPKHAETMLETGTKRKYWFRIGSNRFLYKAEERGTGDDWAEKLACELAKLLGLPCVHYELAEEIGTQTPGVVCQSCSPEPWSLRLGNELLFGFDPSYPAGQKYKVEHHTVDVVATVLNAIQLPPVEWNIGLPTTITTALETFAGYILLDAWVGNQDRHHENWAALEKDGVLHLCPTYDHAASMARTVLDTERAERLASRDRGRQIPKFVQNALSGFYASVADKKPLTTHNAWLKFAGHSPTASATWLAQLASITDDTVGGLVARVPSHRMTAVCKEFTRQLLRENRRRLLEGHVS